MNFGLENISRSSGVPAKLTSFIFLNCHVCLAKKIKYFYSYLISVLYLTGPISPCCRLRLIMVLLTQSIFEVFLQRRKTGIHLALRLTGSGEVKISL